MTVVQVGSTHLLERLLVGSGVEAARIDFRDAEGEHLASDDIYLGAILKG